MFFTLCPLMEHFLIPWSFLRVLSDNTCYPLLLALLEVGLSPFPRFWRVSQFLTCLSLVGGHYRSGCPCHYSIDVGYYGDSVTLQGFEFPYALFRQSRVVSWAKM